MKKIPNRTYSLSIKYVRRYKILIFIGVCALFLSQTYGAIIALDWFNVGIRLLVPLCLIIFWYPSIGKILRQLRELSYDSENIYLKEGDQEVVIPFDRISEIEIVSLDGLYKFILKEDLGFGKEILCKPSFWYPFNFRKVDREMENIRRMIRKAHNQKTTIGQPGLASQY